MSKKQTSDHMNGSKVAGTNVKSLSLRGNTAGSIAPSGNLPSGSSQSSSRGKQGNS